MMTVMIIMVAMVASVSSKNGHHHDNNTAKVAILVVRMDIILFSKQPLSLGPLGRWPGPLPDPVARRAPPAAGRQQHEASQGQGTGRRQQAQKPALTWL